MPTACHGKTMKVAILNKYDVFGGAAKAAVRLFTILRARGVEASYLVNSKKSSQEGIVAVENDTNHVQWLDSIVQRYYINENRTEISNTWFSYTPVDSAVDLVAHCLDADVINLHWIEQFASVQALRDIVKLGKPIVWTLHDTRPFTGGCHYPAGCEGFRADCENCIQLVNDPHRLPALQLRQKRKELEGANITVVAPSNWMAEQAASSSLFAGRPVVVIPNSLALDVYTPRSKAEAKVELGIASDTLTLMCGAVDNKEQRKGFHLLLEALQICLREVWFAEKCTQKKIVIMVVGANGHGFSELDIEVKEIGFISSDLEMATVYNATDLFALPSLEDNLPNTIMEAMACGTSVVSFRTGGIPDLIQHGESGILVEKGDTGGLARALMSVLRDDIKRERFAAQARLYIEREFNEELLSSKYVNLFSELLSSNGKEKGRLEADQIEHHDAVTGFAIKRYMQAIVKSADTSVGQGKAFDPDYVNLVQLKESVGKVCQYRLTSHPIKKIRAYRDMLQAFRDCK